MHSFNILHAELMTLHGQCSIMDSINSMRLHVRMRVCTRTDAYAHCWEYFVTMKLLQLSTNSSGVLFLLLELVSSLLPLANSSLKLDVIRVTNTTNDLQQYLCGTIDILTRRGMGNFNYSSIQMYYVTSRGLSQRALSRLERATMAAN